ncbi:glycosyltransferase [bacterium]|jgi:cellulose synthase/poly-beta-1,6-N-acetylglucosamine synthase-like glycosyltransferase|nr:glycosyltransferase [bacterium]MDB4125777.1 glycosyltransferase [Candidatus Neomarinimicrobiota bacterium]|tara:strand:- start:456 stop:1568 length:1113 start_codon:yes stop_codon:yes gene_type:complete
MILTIIYFILFIYLIYFIWIIEPLFKKDEIHISNYNPFISIVISAKNESNNIPLLLESLQKQTYPLDKYEIIIANDGSKDDTLTQLIHAQNKISNLFVIDIKKTPTNWGSKKWALNKCFHKSKGEIIIQTDADCIHPSAWVFNTVQIFQNQNIGLVCGASYIGKKNIFWDQILKFESLAQESFTYANAKRNLFLSCTARNIAFRKKVFEEINGYDNISHIDSGDDDLLLHKIVTLTDYEIKFLANKNILVSSNSPQTIKELLLQRLRYASKGILYYKLETPKEVKIILPFLIIANVASAFSIISFIIFQNYIWLIPFILKIFSDIILILKYMEKLNISFNIIYFIILMVIHPFYMITFGLIAPFTKVQWK